MAEDICTGQFAVVHYPKSNPSRHLPPSYYPGDLGGRVCLAYQLSSRMHLKYVRTSADPMQTKPVLGGVIYQKFEK